MSNTPITEQKPPLIILSGPTACGKTELSIALAKAISGEIISADSMQVYKGFDIGTAKIKPEEMQGIPHHLIDILEPEEEFNVFRFQSLAKQAMAQIRSRGHIPILVGGTGFYIQAVLYDIHFSQEEEKKDYRIYLENLAKEKGAAYLHGLLQKADPESAAQIHAHNIKRTIRALEYYEETGRTISAHNKEERSRLSPYRFAYFVLNRNRAVLYERINARVDQMLAQGLEAEVKQLLQDGVSPACLAMQGLGYKETADYLLGNCSLEEAVCKIKTETRHFAKRQLTWFRREKEVTWLTYEEYQNNSKALLQAMLARIKEKEIINK